MAKAERYWQRAVELRKNDGDLMANIAQLLLSRGQVDEGKRVVQRAFQNNPTPAARLELLLYSAAHGLQNIDIASAEIEVLLSKGFQSLGWDFNPTLNWVRDNRPKNLTRIDELARKISAPSHPM